MALFLIFLLPKLFTQNSTKVGNYSILINPEDAKPRWSSEATVSFINKEGKPEILVVGEKDYNKPNESASFYADVFDATTNANLKNSKITRLSPSSINRINITTISNGKIYFIVNNTNIFEFNTTTYATIEVTKNLFVDISEFNLGLAKIEFVQPEIGDGLAVLTNVGKNRNRV